MKTRFKLIPAVYLFLRQSDQILLLKRANTDYQEGMYSVPAGHLDGGELAKVAMCRETKEEVNISIRERDLKFVHLSHRLNGSPEQERIDLFFECWQWQGRINNNEPDKCDDLRWFKIDQLPNVIPHVKTVLQKTLQDDHYSEYLSEP
jgi:ADP-ribose pyrophosphatase YjhB (NUDIX family)